MLPNRIPVNIRNITIPNPALLYQRDTDPSTQTFQGLTEYYDFKRQTKNYQELSKVLKDNNIEFQYVASAQYRNKRHRANHHRFVVTTKCNTVVWHKYVANHPQSGQNHLFLSGIRIKVSVFLSLSKDKQNALLSGDKVFVKLYFDPKELKYLDETDLIWS